MAEPRPARRPGWRPRDLLRLAGSASYDLLRRAYAFALIVLIFWVSFAAMKYLVVSLVAPLETPAQVRAIPSRMDEELLHGRRPDWLGLRSVENPRAPLAYYHRLTSWLPPDNANTCTRSGCHGPLPHANRIEVRAFLNMHAASIHCGVCHMEHERTPLSLTWYDRESGRASEAPVLLRALSLLQELGDPPRADDDARARLSDLLRRAARAADNDAALERSAAHLAAVRAATPSFPRIVREARDVVNTSLRGAYGVKLALKDAAGRPVLAHPGTAAAIERYLREGPRATPEQREALLAAVHPFRRPAAIVCTDCHRKTGGVLDLAAAGYPPSRIQQLQTPAIFQMIEHIGRGADFHMPQIVTTPVEPRAPHTQPAPR
ncbi:MAG: hypothetical protein LC135_12630 [Phycisphaerae bacterium]|jgi:hypothetical protein|nr:hypothetical protein [Phycisphaerae bacterium]MCZ2400697.1 hypothetical protein [Phycisphaerae bacterium]